MLGTGTSIMHVQDDHLGHLLGSHETDVTVPVLRRLVNPYTVSSPNYTSQQLHDACSKPTGYRLQSGQQGSKHWGSSDLIHMVTQQLV